MPIYTPNTFNVSGNAQVAGGTGGGGVVPLPTGTTINWQLDEFTTTGTWNKPSQAVLVEVVVIGTGGGGSSGGRRATGVASRGGGAGGSGAPVWATFNANGLPSSVVVSIGAGGNGAAANTIDDTNPAAGGSGGATTFGRFLVVGGATGGVAGGASGSPSVWQLGGTLPRLPHIYSWVTSGGSTISGVAQLTFPPLTTASWQYYPAAPGTGVTAANVMAAGSAGNQMYNLLFSLNTAAAAGAVGGGNGGAGVSDYNTAIGQGEMMFMSGNPGTKFPGSTGGSGGSALAAAGGAGGAPGAYGASGAGGGGSRNGFNSGAGGAGGGALVKILTMYLT
jgi:hypothetical protein